MKFKNLNYVKRDDAKEIRTNSVALNTFNGSEQYDITVKVSRNLKLSAGNITISRHLINDKYEAKINVAYNYYKEFGIDRTIKTLKHEFAHLMAYHKTGKLDHGNLFKTICTELGGSMNPTMAGTTFSASACDQYIKRQTGYAWKYTCKCGSTMKRVKRISSKKRNNPWCVCTTCKTSLSMWKEERI